MARGDVGVFVKAIPPSSSVLMYRGSAPLASLAAKSLRLLESNTMKENWPYMQDLHLWTYMALLISVHWSKLALSMNYSCKVRKKLCLTCKLSIVMA